MGFSRKLKKWGNGYMGRGLGAAGLSEHSSFMDRCEDGREVEEWWIEIEG